MWEGKIWYDEVPAGPMYFIAESNNEMCEASRTCGIFSGEYSSHDFVCFSYSTIYTMFPVFSLVLDKDVKSEVAMLYPELYKDLLKVFNTHCQSAATYDTETYMENGKYDVFYYSLSTGPTTIFQDISNMGPNKYLSR